MTAKGWTVINKTQTAVQLKRGRKWNRLLLIAGLVLLPLGVGLLVLILALIDYLIKPEKIITVYESDLLAGKEPNPSALSMPLLVGGLFVWSGFNGDCIRASFGPYFLNPLHFPNNKLGHKRLPETRIVYVLPPVFGVSFFPLYSQLRKPEHLILQ